MATQSQIAIHIHVIMESGQVTMSLIDDQGDLHPYALMIDDQCTTIEDPIKIAEMASMSGQVTVVMMIHVRLLGLEPIDRLDHQALRATAFAMV